MLGLMKTALFPEGSGEDAGRHDDEYNQAIN